MTAKECLLKIDIKYRGHHYAIYIYVFPNASHIYAFLALQEGY